jgi:hypothetical protein
MTIYGMSQSTGVERRLMVEKSGEGVLLVITDHDGNRARARFAVQPGDLLAATTDAPPGGATLEGTSQPGGAKVLLDLEVRRNEVLLTARPASGEGADIAVGFDDFQDALEGALSPG